MLRSVPSPAKLDREQARAVLLAAQGLAAAPRTPPPPARIVADHGFVRTLGGAEAYAAVLARRGELSRDELDAEVETGELQVIPAARGCIYLVDRPEVPRALRLADLLSRRRAEREQEKAGIRPGELDELADRVEAALREHGALDPTGLRKALPDGAVRSLGDAGKKVGLSSTLPPTLRQLEIAGRVARHLDGGRLDSERYRWAATDSNPFADAAVAAELADEAALLRHLAGRWFHWIGLGTADAFAAWAGLGKRDASSAVEALGLAPVEVAGVAGDWRADPAALEAAGGAVDGSGHLLPFEDNLLHLPGGPGLLTDPEHLELEVPSWGRRGRVALGDTTHLGFRAVVADGRLAGFWDFDPDAGEVVVGFFAAPSAAARAQVEGKARPLGHLLATGLGHGKSFSLDSDDRLRRRVEEIRGFRK